MTEMLASADPAAARGPRHAARTACRIDDFDGVALERLAAQVGTPAYVYSATVIADRIGALKTALTGLDALVCYAVKANPSHAVLARMHAHDLGADIVSGGELLRALRAGMPAGRIVFSGVGKSEDEIAAALDVGILRFNVESRDELHTIDRLARARQRVARAAVRVNPDVDARTHAKISTGKAENKFGVSLQEARSWFDGAAGFTHVRLDGLHVHIGSQLLDLDPVRRALRRVDDFRRALQADGHAVHSIDVGGGLGVCYRAGHDRPPPVADYVAAIREALTGFDGQLLLEPGRWLMAESGLLLTRVVRVKDGASRRFLVLDAAMNDLLRPSLYDAWHDIVAVGAAGERPMQAYDVVGPVCETGDTFARGRELPACEAGDLLAIRGAGAYGMSMASTYNSRPLPPEVLVENGRFAVVRARQTFEQMTAGERAAGEWMQA